MQSFTIDDIVQIKNTDSEDYVYTFLGQSGYVIEAGKVERIPGSMAQHVLKHLCDTIMQKRGLIHLINNKPAREAIYEELFVKVEKTIKPMPKTEAEIAKDEYDRVNSANNTTISTAGVEDELADSLIGTLENEAGSEEQAFPTL